MRQTKLITSTLAILAASAIAVAAVRPAVFFSQEGEMGPPEPTEEHMMLQKSVGEWVGTLTMSMEGMPTDPVDATETVKAFGGFWTVSHFKCDFMGAPYEGMGSNGYDPMTRKYISTWQDNMSPAFVMMEGEMGEDGKMTYTYEAIDMHTGKMAPHRNELVMSDDAYTMDFFIGEGAAAKKTMTISMKRKAKK